MGKRKQFDETEVLTQVAEYFWEHGYGATRVDQLAALTGLTKTSLYNAFGNKEALFLKAANLYVGRALNSEMADVDLERPLSENLEALLLRLVINCEHEKRAYGCLLTNSIVELAANEPSLYQEIESLSANIRHLFRELFAAYAGKLNTPLSTDQLTDFFMTFMQGLRVISRKQNPETTLKGALETFVELVRSIEN